MFYQEGGRRDASKDFTVRRGLRWNPESEVDDGYLAACFLRFIANPRNLKAGGDLFKVTQEGGDA